MVFLEPLESKTCLIQDPYNIRIEGPNSDLVLKPLLRRLHVHGRDVLILHKVSTVKIAAIYDSIGFVGEDELLVEVYAVVFK